MAFKFNPLTGNLDLVGSGGGGGGSGPFTGITGTPNEIAYFDVFGNGTSDSLATRLSNAVLQTDIASNTYAQLNVNDGISSEAIIQADNIGSIGNAITLTFDGVIDVDQAILNWNTANPANTCSLIGGTGTIIVPAGSPSLAGGGKAGISMGAVTLPVGVLQGNMQYAQDDTSGAIGFNLTGNFATVFGRNQQGVFNGGFSSAGVGFISASPETVELLLTNFMGQASGLTAEIGLIGINANNSGFVIDDVNSVFSLEDNATSLIIPFGLTASIGDVLVVTADVGQNYTLGFTSPTAGVPGGVDTNVQYNDGGVFGGDSNFIWNKTFKRFQVGDTAKATNEVVFTVDDSLNFMKMDAPTGSITIGDPNNQNNGLAFKVLPGSNSSTLTGFLPVEAGFATINFTGVGLDDISLTSNWSRTNNTTYTVTVEVTNFKAIWITGPTLPFTVGDTIENAAVPSETANIFAIQQLSPTEFWLICDQSGGAWTSPASVNVIAGINVGATANVINWYDNTDVFSVASTGDSYNYWPMTSTVSLNGASLGWGAALGHTVNDFWTIDFLANGFNFLNGSWASGSFDIGLHTGIPQNISPKAIRIENNPSTPSLLKIGNVAQNGTVLSFGQNSNDGMMYFNSSTNNRYFDIQPSSGLFGIGDISGAVNSNTFTVYDSSGETISQISSSFQVVTPAADVFLYIDVANQSYKFGDISTANTGIHLEIDDLNGTQISKKGATVLSRQGSDQLEITTGLAFSKWRDGGNSTPIAVLVDDLGVYAGSGSIGATFDLPDSVLCVDGKIIIVKDDYNLIPGSGAFYIRPNGTDTIDRTYTNASPYQMMGTGESVMLCLDQASGNWRMV